MKTALVTAAAVLTFASSAGAFSYKAQVSNCRDTLEQWIAHEADGGRKLSEQQTLGAILVARVNWNSGTVEDVTVAPVDGQFCIVARRYVSGPSTASSQ